MTAVLTFGFSDSGETAVSLIVTFQLFFHFALAFLGFFYIIRIGYLY